jgi:5'-phosphate synthase pdxT subunit
MTKRTKIGVLDLQGGVLEHINHLEAIGIEAVKVKRAEQLDELAGLILPGGESTCMTRLLNIFEFTAPMEKAFADGMKIWGTCAGSILIANTADGEPSHFDFIDINVDRNAFGPQIDSFNTEVKVPEVSDNPIFLTFIRAPKITKAGEGVKVLLKLDDYIAAAESENVLATVFHPELTPSLAFHKYFARKCGLAPNDVEENSQLRTSWMKYARITNPSKK